MHLASYIILAGVAACHNCTQGSLAMAHCNQARAMRSHRYSQKRLKLQSILRKELWLLSSQ